VSVKVELDLHKAVAMGLVVMRCNEHLADGYECGRECKPDDSFGGWMCPIGHFTYLGVRQYIKVRSG
jgi:hypothetical protein